MRSEAKQWRQGKARPAAAGLVFVSLTFVLLDALPAAPAAGVMSDALPDAEQFLLDTRPPLGWTVLFYLCILAFAGLAIGEIMRRLHKASRRGGSHGSPPLSQDVHSRPIPLDSIATLDDQGRILRANPRFQAESSLSVELIEGHPIWAVYQKGFGQT